MPSSALQLTRSLEAFGSQPVFTLRFPNSFISRPGHNQFFEKTVELHGQGPHEGRNKSIERSCLIWLMSATVSHQAPYHCPFSPKSLPKKTLISSTLTIRAQNATNCHNVCLCRRARRTCQLCHPRNQILSGPNDFSLSRSAQETV